MKIESLVNRVLKLYTKESTPGREEIFRCVERYFYKRMSEAKLQYLVDQLYKKHDINLLAQTYRNRIQLSETTESIVLHRLRQAHMNKAPFDLEDLNVLQFRALAKLILEQHGYEILILPPLKSSPIDFLVLNNQHINAVSCLQRLKGFNVAQKTIIDIHTKSKLLQSERLIVFTSGEFDAEVRAYAEKYNIYLIDRNMIAQLADNLAENKLETENSILLTEKNFADENSFFLESDIRSLKTKVRIEDLSYYPDRDNNVLVFEGRVWNSGKTPVNRLSANLHIYGRESGVIKSIRHLIGDGKLAVGEKTEFKCVIDDMTDFQWVDICQYRIKLSYQNV